MKQALILPLIFGLASCSVFNYGGDIQQGNVMTASQIQSVKPGMSLRQVEERLGPPVLTQPFNHDQVIYIYRDAPSGGTVTQKVVKITFKHGRVTQVA